jgi:hypothetical protein
MFVTRMISNFYNKFVPSSNSKDIPWEEQEKSPTEQLAIKFALKLTKEMKSRNRILTNDIMCYAIDEEQQCIFFINKDLPYWHYVLWIYNDIPHFECMNEYERIPNRMKKALHPEMHEFAQITF